MAIKLNIQKFPTAFPSKVLARNGGGHMYSLKHDDDLWNGAVVAKGEYEALDLYNASEAVRVNAKVVDTAANGNYYVEILEDIPATDALIVYNAPVIEEEYNKAFLLESNFYIPAEMEARAYPLREGDIWELSVDSFTQKPTVGETVVTTITGKKWAIEQTQEESR